MRKTAESCLKMLDLIGILVIVAMLAACRLNVPPTVDIKPRSIALTLNNVSHVLPSLQDEDADKIDELLVPMKLDYELKPVKEAGVNKRVSRP